MNNNKDPLAKFVSKDVRATDRQKLADFLELFLERIDPDSGEMSLLPLFHELPSNGEKIEALLIVAKARSLLSESSDGMLPGEIAVLEIMPIGSVKSSLKSLYDSKRIKKDNAGKYYVPNYRVDEIIGKFKK